MPLAVIAEIGAGSRIVRAVTLHAVGHGVAIGGSGGDCHGAIVVIAVIVIAGRIGRTAIAIAAIVAA